MKAQGGGVGGKVEGDMSWLFTGVFMLILGLIFGFACPWFCRVVSAGEEKSDKGNKVKHDHEA